MGFGQFPIRRTSNTELARKQGNQEASCKNNIRVVSFRRRILGFKFCKLQNIIGVVVMLINVFHIGRRKPIEQLLNILEQLFDNQIPIQVHTYVAHSIISNYIHDFFLLHRFRTDFRVQFDVPLQLILLPFIAYFNTF